MKENKKKTQQTNFSLFRININCFEFETKQKIFKEIKNKWKQQNCTL